MNIYATLTGKTIPEIEAEFAGQGYGVFKPAVGEAVVEALRPIREEAERLMKDKAYLNELIGKYWFLTDEILGKDVRSLREGLGKSKEREGQDKKCGEPVGKWKK